jgi:oxalate decarboxylase
MGHNSFRNNVPDPLMSGKELPTFKFELEKSKGKVLGNSFGKEVTVDQLPISKGIAGVSMQLEPGVMRELHWHATAAEWAFVLKGRTRTTVINPAGETETNDFDPGDIWYFPRGHAHVLECLGNEPTHFILIFDNGYFSEFGTFSITDWIGHAPKALLAKNFGLSESAFDGFPSEEVYFARGAIPPDKYQQIFRARAFRHHRHTSFGCFLKRRTECSKVARMARGFHALSDFDYNDRRHYRSGTGRSSRVALAS